MSTLSSSDFEEGIPNGLLLFNLPPYQTAISSSYYVNVRPVSQLSDCSPVEFHISNQGTDYMDLQRMKLHCKVNVTHSDGTPLTQDEHVTPVDNFLQSLWSQIVVYLQGQLVSSDGFYAHKAKLQTMLNYGGEATNTQLQSQLYFPDEVQSESEMNLSDVAAGANLGVLSRGSYIALSKSCSMEGALNLDILQMHRYLINGIDLSLKLFRNTPNFCLTSDVVGAEYKINLEDIYLKVCKIKVNSSLIIGHSRALESSTAKYPYVKTEMKMSSIASSQMSYIWDNLYSSVCPNRMVICLVDSEALNGKYALNPYCFTSKDVHSVGAYLNGVSVPGRPLEISPEDDVSAYVQMFDDTSKFGLDVGNSIDRNAFKNGSALFVFSLEPGFLQGEYLNLVRTGNIRLEIKFKSALTKPLSCLVYSEFSSLMEIDATRNVFMK
jgi:hypothetical protein